MIDPAQLHLDLLPGPHNIARRRFANGVVGLAYENRHSPSVVVHGWLWAGSIDVPREQAGLAAFTASMLKRGTQNRTFAQINEAVESLGATLSIGGGGHTTRFTVKCLVEDLPQLLDLLTDCLYHPTFPPEYIERRRTQILTAIEQRNDSTQAVASLAFGELMYPGHPYSLSQLGYEDSIAALMGEDIEAFYRTHYGPQKMGVTIVGAMPCSQGLDFLEAAFASWIGANHDRAPLPEVARPTQPIRKSILMPAKFQSDLVIGWPAMTRTWPDFDAASLANCILGEFGLMGRLGTNVRQNQGLAYYVYTALEAGLGTGAWTAMAGIDPENIELIVESILDEIKRLQTEPVDAEELADNKSYIIGSLPLRLEGNEGIAAQIVEMELFDLGLDYVQRFPSLVASLTAQDVIEVARTYLTPDAYVLAVAGPQASAE
ncbi:MAG: insulinase family protein [Anaerolineae bacterium]|nr:insulinase family protein [Anaerolineae bacterium]